jgi:hypothetical protein
MLPVSMKVTKLVLSAHLKTIPALFLPIARMRENNKRTVVRPTSDVLITGYWRCANHYATYAFISSQKRDVHVARLFHAPAQLILADRWKVPTLLLIRNPMDAVASATVFLDHDDPLPFLKFYNIYHSAVAPYRDRVVISDFDRTTSDFGGVITELNERYGRNFDPYLGSPEEEQRVKEMIRDEHSVNSRGQVQTLPLPSHEKDQLKEKVREKLRSPRCASLLEEAQHYYCYLSSVAQGV